jgi:hypothetical protein
VTCLKLNNFRNLRSTFALLLIDTSLEKNTSLILRVKQEALGTATFEAFLEAAPQLILQLSIVLMGKYSFSIICPILKIQCTLCICLLHFETLHRLANKDRAKVEVGKMRKRYLMAPHGCVCKYFHLSLVKEPVYNHKESIK